MRGMMNEDEVFGAFPVLETERLILREIKPADAEDIFRIYADPQVMRYWGAAPMRSIDEAHRQQKDSQGRPWLGIGYHFVVGNGRNMGDGEVQATFRWREQLAGAHAGNRTHNEQGIGICLIGNFEEQPPTPKQIDATRDLVRQLAKRHAITRERILRHSDIQATACPGRQFPWDRVLADVPARADGS